MGKTGTGYDYDVKTKTIDYERNNTIRTVQSKGYVLGRLAPYGNQNC